MSKSKLLKDLRDAGGVARGVAFDLVVALDFYDGPEAGFAFCSSGEGFRFRVIGEARYPILRAFTFALLNGNWANLARDVLNTSPRPSNSLMVFSSEHDSAVSRLLASVTEAAEQSCYIGVGSAYLDKLAVAAISKSELDELRCSADEAYYRAAHRFIKQVEKRTR